MTRRIFIPVEVYNSWFRYLLYALQKTQVDPQWTVENPSDEGLDLHITSESAEVVDDWAEWCLHHLKNSDEIQEQVARLKLLQF
jgi:hypothetical protein